MIWAVLAHSSELQFLSSHIPSHLTLLRSNSALVSKAGISINLCNLILHLFYNFMLGTWLDPTYCSIHLLLSLFQISLVCSNSCYDTSKVFILQGTLYSLVSKFSCLHHILASSNLHDFVLVHIPFHLVLNGKICNLLEHLYLGSHILGLELGVCQGVYELSKDCWHEMATLLASTLSHEWSWVP